MPRRQTAHRVARTLSASLLTAALLATSACSHGGGLPAPQDSTVLSMLSLVPGTDTRPFVVVNLYAKAADQAKVERPKPGSSAKAVFRYLFKVTADAKTGTFLAPSELAASRAGQLGRPDAFGFDVTNMDADVQAGFGPDGVQAARGRFDKDRIHQRITNFPGLKGQVRQISALNVTIDAWTNKGLTAGGNRPLPIGSFGGNIAVPDHGTLLYATREQQMRNAIGQLRGNGKSLADAADYRDAARALDDRDVFAAAFTVPPAGKPLGDRPGRRTSQATEQLAPAKLVATATGRQPGKDGKAGRAELVIVLVNKDDSAAKENAKRLESMATKGSSFATRQPWSELVKVRSVTSHGRLTIGDFTTERGKTFGWTSCSGTTAWSRRAEGGPRISEISRW